MEFLNTVKYGLLLVKIKKTKTTVYPNPSNNGKVNVVFGESDDKHDVVLVDMAGRLVKQWKAVRNNIQINNLTPGIYHLRIVNSETGNQSIEKIVVSNN